MIHNEPSASLKKKVLLIITVATITFLLNSAVSIWLSEVTNLEIPSIGTIKTIGVEAYWDQTHTNKTEVINWHNIWLGSSKNVTLYVRSISNIKTVLQINATNWSPTNISNNMDLSWNYNEATIDPGEVIQVTITLSTIPSKSFVEYLISNNVKEFSFDIIIQAIAYE